MLKTDFTFFKQNMEAVEKARSQKLSIIVTDDDAMVFVHEIKAAYRESWTNEKGNIRDREKIQAICQG